MSKENKNRKSLERAANVPSPKRKDSRRIPSEPQGGGRYIGEKQSDFDNIRKAAEAPPRPPSKPRKETEWYLRYSKTKKPTHFWIDFLIWLLFI